MNTDWGGKCRAALSGEYYNTYWFSRRRNEGHNQHESEHHSHLAWPRGTCNFDTLDSFKSFVHQKSSELSLVLSCWRSQLVSVRDSILGFATVTWWSCLGVLLCIHRRVLQRMRPHRSDLRYKGISLSLSD
jgi:hypothetical protein